MIELQKNEEGIDDLIIEASSLEDLFLKCAQEKDDDTNI